MTTQEWQPIDTAPCDEAILLWGFEEDEVEDARDDNRQPERTVLTGRRWDGSVSWWSNAGGLRHVVDPTHWMPLPDAPVRS